MWKNRGQGIPYGRALVFGLNPLLGGLMAFPFQMVGTSPRVSKLILGQVALKASRWFCRLSHISNPNKILKVEKGFIYFSDLMNTPLGELFKHR